VTTTCKTEDGSTVHIRNSTTPTNNQQFIYDALGIKKQPLKKVRIKNPLAKK
jgi:hypothetical protein